MVCWRHPLPLGPLLGGMFLYRSLLPFLRTDGCPNFPIRQRPPSIFDGDAAVPPFTHPHLTLGWRVRPAPQLEKSVLVPHHPVLADPALPLQSEYPVQLRSPRRPPVVVLWFSRHPGEPPIVFRQIVPLQIYIGLRVTADLLPSQLLYQPVLVCPVNPFHSPLGLRRAGRDQFDS